MDAEDLSQGALLTWLERKGQAPVGPGPFVKQLVKQRACTFMRHMAQFPEVDSEVLNWIQASEDAHEGAVLDAAVKWLIGQLKAKDDTEGLKVVRGFLASDGAGAAELAAASGMSLKAYYATNQRLRRLVRRMPAPLLRDVSDVLGLTARGRDEREIRARGERSESWERGTALGAFRTR